MDTVEQAIEKFKVRGFSIREHVHYSAPKNDESRINELQELLRDVSDSKSRAFYEFELEEQTKGIMERLHAIKTFAAFRELDGTMRPIMQGFYAPAEGIYHINFLARNLGIDNHSTSTLGAFSLVLEADEKSFQRSFDEYRDRLGISPEVDFTFRTPRFRGQINSPYLIESQNEDFERVYSDVISTIEKLKYPTD
jgi:hypothetical protein